MKYFLTMQDIDILISALGAWVIVDDVMDSILSSMQMTFTNVTGEERKRRLIASREHSKRKMREKEEISTLLKAKLILMKNEILEGESKKTSDMS